jgi:transposase
LGWLDDCGGQLPRRKRSRNDPDFDLRSHLYQLVGVDLTRIDGLQALTVQEIITEIGVDMNRWPTVKHFTSWLTLAPHNDISGGKVLKSRTLKSKNRAAQALRMAAQSVGKSKSALGAYYRRMRARHGAPVAITATAHKLARIVYHMIKYREDYVDPAKTTMNRSIKVTVQIWVAVAGMVRMGH